MSEYHKIETLYERDEKTHKLKPELILKNRIYGVIKSWHWTEKIDGTNIRCIYDGEKLSFGGKTDNAQIPGDLVKYLYELVSAEKVKEVFQASTAVLYGEGYGAGIQKGGLYSPTKKFIMFDALIEGQWWMNRENTEDIAKKIGIDTVPYLGEMTLEEAAEKVKAGFASALGEHGPAEGMVGRTVEPLFDKMGKRLIVKLKTKDF
jgi:hypothetical protein